MIEIKLWKIDKNVTVYVNKKGTLQPVKENKENFVKKIRRFIVKEFVKICDELVIGLKLSKEVETFI